MTGIRNWLGFFVLGTINNLPYVIVNSAARTICNSFGVTNFVGLIFAANVSLALVVKALNTFLLLRVPYGIKFVVNGCLMLTGLFGVSYATSFPMAIMFIAISGSSAAFGENVTLGFLHRFDSKLVNAWSSGTGLAGILGSTLYIIFGCGVGAQTSGNPDKMRDLNKKAFLFTTPVVLIYWIGYFVLIRAPEDGHDAVRDIPETITHSRHSSLNKDNGDEENKPLLSTIDEDIERSNDSIPSVVKKSDEIASSNSGLERLSARESPCRRYFRCFRLCLWLSINLSAVYMFEYVARACAAKVRPKSEYNIGCPELYAAIQLCYQAGVFASRSSVQIIQIKRVEILSVLQGVNMIIWLLDVHYKFMPVYILPMYMVYVGLLGGASYVNIFFRLLNDDTFPKEDREICVNISAMFVTLGIILGTGLETALFTTILKND